MVRSTSTINVLASAYANGVTSFSSNVNSWIGLATGDPGTSSTPSNEASGGTPAYARKQITWGAPSGGAVTTTTPATIDVSAATYTYVIIASASSGNNQWDNCSITSVTMGAQGQIVVTPTFTET